MGKTVNATTLSGLEAFRHLRAETRSALASLLHGQEFSSGSLIISATEDSRDVYFLVAGRVRATLYSRGGKEIAFQDLEPGQMFGELSAIDGQNRSTNVVALTDSLVAVMRQADFQRACAEHPDLAQYIMLRLASLSRMLLERVFEISTLGVNNRIHAELLRLARKSLGDRDATAIEIPDAPTHAEIANRVSTHREAVTREIKRLEKLGLLEWGRSRRCVLDMPKLAAMVEEVRV